jgi:twitching motility protein PilT
MMNTARIADLIREPEKTEGITDAIEDGAFHHMQSFSQHLVQLVVGGVVEREVAAAAATNRHDFEIAVERALREQQAAAEEPDAAPGAGHDDVAEGAEEDEPMPGLRLASAE